jgi:hypothetical protein
MNRDHRFEDDLRWSEQVAELPFWRRVYDATFPGIDAMTRVRRAGWAQQAGIDRRLHLVSGKTLDIEEKARREVYPDVALEIRHDFGRYTRPGWTASDLGCDYVCYAWVPAERAVVLPFQTLRLVWERFGAQWVAASKERRSPFRSLRTFNSRGRYYTEGICVPVRVLLATIRDAMCLAWDDRHGYVIRGEQLALDLEPYAAAASGDDAASR